MEAIEPLSTRKTHYRFARRRNDRKLSIAGLIEEGIETGVFREVDADRAAERLSSAIDGTMYRRLTTEEESAVRSARKGIGNYIDSYLTPDSGYPGDRKSVV